MVTVLEEGPSFGSQFGAGLGRGLSGQASNSLVGRFAQAMSERKALEAENEALKKMGIDLSGIRNPDIRKAFVQAHTKGKEEKRSLETTFEPILDEMKSLGKYVGPVNLASLNPYSETSGKRNQINTLRLSLEGLFRDLTLKGQFPKAIYERVLEHLPQASDTKSQYENKIEAIEKILHSHTGETSEGEASSGGKKGGKVQFNLSNPEHKAKRDQLLKKFKGDREKTEAALNREFML